MIFQFEGRETEKFLMVTSVTTAFSVSARAGAESENSVAAAADPNIMDLRDVFLEETPSSVGLRQACATPSFNGSWAMHQSGRSKAAVPNENSRTIPNMRGKVRRVIFRSF